MASVLTLKLARMHGCELCLTEAPTALPSVHLQLELIVPPPSAWVLLAHQKEVQPTIVVVVSRD